MKLKYAYGIASGAPEIGQEEECQNKINIVNENGTSVISLADPMEKTKNSKYCAEVASRAVGMHLSEHFDELYTSEDSYIRESIQESIAKYFQEEWIDPPGMDCSLLFVAMKDERYLAGHLGNGLIARLDGRCMILSKSEKGLEPSKSEIAIEDSEIAKLRIYKGGLLEPYGFLLMNQGACQSLYDDSASSLSPACGTFFEWLKEYDEETVSEALIDNINKYFVKTKGDISIALMLSDKNGEETGMPSETDHFADEPETDELAKENTGEQENSGAAKRQGKNRGKEKYVIAALILILTIVSFVMRQPGLIQPKQDADVTPPKQEEKAEATSPKQAVTEPEDNQPSITNSESYEPSVTFSTENPQSFDPGEYQVGSDIPAGEYFIWTGDMLKPDSVEINGDTCLSEELYCMTIRVEEGDTLISNYRFTAAENVNPVKATNGVLSSGKYKIGKDIAPGKYKISQINKKVEGRYYSVLDGEISNDTEFTAGTTVTVPEAGYVVFYNSALAVGKK